MTITLKEFQLLAEYIKLNYGIHLKEEKRNLVKGRLINLINQMGFNNFTEYYNYIISDKTGDAAITLANKITTNHTYFMREEDHFNYLRDQLLPYFMNTVKGNDIRIWSAACSTGEEPYTIAMILDEYFQMDKYKWDTKVLATDISESVLDIAKEGVYSNERILPLPNHWKTKYFKRKDDNNSIIIDKIKGEVIYRRFNLMEEIFPFRNKFHFIFCRNVMIYFDNKTKEILVNKLYNILEHGGYLFIGHSEHINREKTKFKYVKPAVYRKE